MNYRKTQEVLNRLDELLIEIKIKENAIKCAIHFRKGYVSYHLKKEMEEIITGHQNDRDTLIQEFNQLKKAL